MTDSDKITIENTLSKLQKQLLNAIQTEYINGELSKDSMLEILDRYSDFKNWIETEVLNEKTVDSGIAEESPSLEENEDNEEIQDII